MRKWIQTILAIAVVLAGTAHATHRSPQYDLVQATADVSASALSSRVTLVVHLRNMGPLPAACAITASGETRVAGVSVDGLADVTFDSLGSYRGFTVVCHAN